MPVSGDVSLQPRGVASRGDRTRAAAPTRVLFLAANPKSSDQMELNLLSLDREAREITNKIRDAEHRDSFDLVTRWAVSADDLLQHLNEQRPEIVHFSGHGMGDAGPDGGLVLEAENGEARVVSTSALKRLFSTLKDNIRLVVLNACLSETQANAIAEHIDCVVGMSAEIGDQAAITFAASFYRALGFGRSVREAFEQGLVALEVHGIPETATPRLICRQGVDAASLVLVKAMPRTGSGTPWRWYAAALAMVLLAIVAIVGIRAMRDVRLAHESQAILSVADKSTGVKLPLNAAGDTPQVGIPVWLSFLNPQENEPTYLLVQEGDGTVSIYPDAEVRAAKDKYTFDKPGTGTLMYITLAKSADAGVLDALKKSFAGKPPDLGAGQHVVWSWRAPVLDDAPSKRGLGAPAARPPKEWMKKVMEDLKAAGARTVSGRSFHVDL